MYLVRIVEKIPGSGGVQGFAHEHTHPRPRNMKPIG
jgi:hypothetical protein